MSEPRAINRRAGPGTVQQPRRDVLAEQFFGRRDARGGAAGGLDVNGLTEADLALDDALAFYDASAAANRKAALTRLGGLLAPGTCDGRLTLTSGTPVTASDVINAATIYFTPYKGDRVALYDGTRWKLYAFAELSHGLAGATTDRVHDLFLYDNAGTLMLERLAWTTNASRATALATRDGVLVKSGDPGRRYLGTFRTHFGAASLDDKADRRWLWNYYNRVRRPFKQVEGTTSWTYTTDTWRPANNNNDNRVSVVVGVREALLHLRAIANAANTAAEVRFNAGIDEDGTTNNDADLIGVGFTFGGNVPVVAEATLQTYPAIGYHFYQWTERSAAAGTTTWFGDNAAADQYQSGLSGWIEG